jgi:hypothetical protein
MRQQNKDATLYNQFEWLNTELLKIDAKEMGVSLENTGPNGHELERFVKEESELPA